MFIDIEIKPPKNVCKPRTVLVFDPLDYQFLGEMHYTKQTCHNLLKPSRGGFTPDNHYWLNVIAYETN